jgi:hypothetical protein
VAIIFPPTEEWQQHNRKSAGRIKPPEDKLSPQVKYTPPAKKCVQGQAQIYVFTAQEKKRALLEGEED